MEHFEFFEVKETILINESGEVIIALEANEVIESFKIGCDTSIQYFNDKQQLVFMFREKSKSQQNYETAL